MQPGDLVTIGQIQTGCRAYLAVSGGFDVPKIMGSHATYKGAKIDGFKGRPIKTADLLPVCIPSLIKGQRVLSEKYIPDYPAQNTVRAITGPQDDYFDQGLITLFESEYRVSAKADRMGYRLTGDPLSIKEGMPQSIVSDPSVPGSIQIPPDGQPIILLVEQTVGGYAKAATIISSDIGRVAQATPGDRIRFEKTDITLAHSLLAEHHQRLGKIRALLKSAIDG